MQSKKFNKDRKTWNQEHKNLNQVRNTLVAVNVAQLKQSNVGSSLDSGT